MIQINGLLVLSQRSFVDRQVRSALAGGRLGMPTLARLLGRLRHAAECYHTGAGARKASGHR